MIVRSVSENRKQKACIGRFAPSPTGKLHFGSLVSALASYLDVKSRNGKWLLRMEDLDPPREEPGAADSILASLEAHHLFWDQSVLYQSRRLPAYQEAMELLKPFLYDCDCTRRRIAKLGGRYDGHCRQYLPVSGRITAVRIRTDVFDNDCDLLHGSEQFNDLFLGFQNIPLNAGGDFIVKRKDDLFAYQLAVVVDDNFQKITRVVRGFDILNSTSRQRYLLLLMNLPLPHYGHIPLAVGKNGHKLSKQTGAVPLNDQQAASNLAAALRFLNHEPPVEVVALQNCDDLLDWAVKSWEGSRIPRTC